MQDKEKSSFNLIACNKYDKENNSIDGIFNSIKIAEDKTLTFDLLTIIGIINKIFKTVTIVYCIYNVQKGIETAKIINKSSFYPTKNGAEGFNGRARETTMSKLSSAIKAIHISNMKFTEKGDYEIRAYVFWDDTNVDGIMNGEKEIVIEKLIEKNENLESIINIEIG